MITQSRFRLLLSLLPSSPSCFLHFVAPPPRPAKGFPFCFRVCGLGLAVLLVLVTLAAAELSMRLLLIASQLTGRRSYEVRSGDAAGATRVTSP